MSALKKQTYPPAVNNLFAVKKCRWQPFFLKPVRSRANLPNSSFFMD
jgi:hypothetical protein